MTLDSVGNLIGYPTEEQRLRREVEAARRLRRTSVTRRAAARKSPGVLTGYPIVYGQETTILGLWREVIAPGAARSRLGVDDVVLVQSHDTKRLLGRTGSGTLRLEDHPQGVWMRGELPDTATGREVLELVRRGDLSQGSFAFTVKRESWYQETGKELPLCVVEELGGLYDVTVCPHGAYPQTSVEEAGEAIGRTNDRRTATVLNLRELQLSERALPYPPTRELRQAVLQRPRRRYEFGLTAA